MEKLTKNYNNNLYIIFFAYADGIPKYIRLVMLASL